MVGVHPHKCPPKGPTNSDSYIPHGENGTSPCDHCQRNLPNRTQIWIFPAAFRGPQWEVVLPSISGLNTAVSSCRLGGAFAGALRDVRGPKRFAMAPKGAKWSKESSPKCVSSRDGLSECSDPKGQYGNTLLTLENFFCPVLVDGAPWLP